MLKSCKYCGKVHPVNYTCPMKPKKPYGKYDYTDRDVWKFRHGQAWKDKAEEIKERDHWMCLCCLDKNIINSKGLEVHHIIPLAQDMETRLDDDNLITLCRTCHEQAEKGEITRSQLKDVLRRRKSLKEFYTPVV